MIHVYASQPNYWRHLAPIVDALREAGHEVETWASRAIHPWGRRARGIPPGELMIVASWIDAREHRDRPVVYCEHGAGQMYQDGPPAGYGGAPGLSHVVLFIAPNEQVAAQWRALYPQAVVAAVGCPALDQFLPVTASEQPDQAAHDDDDAGDPEERDVDRGGEHERIVERARDSGAHPTTSEATQPMTRSRVDPSSERPLVAITSHWRCGVCPETMPALPLYERALRELREQDSTDTGIRWLGHAHPRNVRRAGEMWERLGIPFELDPDVVLGRLRNAQSAALIVDSSSIAYEAAALDIPVLNLNAPTYRRDVEHGARFWSHVPGLQCDRPSDLEAALRATLADPPEARALRRRAAAYVYASTDGGASRRAVTAIEGVL